MAFIEIALAGLISLARLSMAEPSAADRATYDAACASSKGAGYVASFDANDNPVECVLPPQKPCFFGGYIDQKTGLQGCCGAPGLQYKFDPTTKNGACCNAGEEYQWNAQTNLGACIKPPPPKPVVPVDPPLVCPGANNQRRTINGITFQIYCNRAVWRWVPAVAYFWYRAEVAKMPLLPGVTTAEACLQNCAYDPACQGANWLENKSCGKNVYGSGLYGNMYQNPPNADTWGYQCMSFVSVPKRPGT